MDKTKIKGNERKDIPVLKYKTYSINEITNAGGTTAFSDKIGKNPENLMNRLKILAQDSFLTDEEAKQALKLLEEYK